MRPPLDLPRLRSFGRNMREAMTGRPDGPALWLDGQMWYLSDLPDRLVGETAVVMRPSDRTFPALCDRLAVKRLSLSWLNLSNLAPLARVQGLVELELRHSLLLSDLSVLAQMPRLQVLVLTMLNAVPTLSPLAALPRLEALSIDGGLGKPWRVDSLTPLSALAGLQELYLDALDVTHGGLRPLAACRALRRLSLPLTFETEDYAWLAAFMPDTACPTFQPYVRLAQPRGEDDVRVVGRGKPYLNAARDAAQLLDLAEAFLTLKDGYRSGRLF